MSWDEVENVGSREVNIRKETVKLKSNGGPQCITLQQAEQLGIFQ